MSVESIWNRVGIELAIPGSALGLSIDCATRPDLFYLTFHVHILN